MSRLRLVLAVLMISTCCFARYYPKRTWTSTTGDKIVGSFKGIEDGKVEILTGKSRVVKIKLKYLIEEDQQYVIQNANTGTPQNTTNNSKNRNASRIDYKGELRVDLDDSIVEYTRQVAMALVYEDKSEKSGYKTVASGNSYLHYNESSHRLDGNISLKGYPPPQGEKCILFMTIAMMTSNEGYVKVNIQEKLWLLPDPENGVVDLRKIKVRIRSSDIRKAADAKQR